MNKKIFLSLVIVGAAFLLIHHASAQANLAKKNLALANSQPTVVKIVNFPQDKTQLASLNSAPAIQIKPQNHTVNQIKTDSISSSPKKIVTAKPVRANTNNTHSVKKRVIVRRTNTRRETNYRSRIHYTSRYGTTMPWDATSLHFLSNIAAFDYSTSIRAKIIRNIEAYARRHHVHEVTMSMMNQMAISE